MRRYRLVNTMEAFVTILKGCMEAKSAWDTLATVVRLLCFRLLLV